MFRLHESVAFEINIDAHLHSMMFYPSHVIFILNDMTSCSSGLTFNIYFYLGINHRTCIAFHAMSVLFKGKHPQDIHIIEHVV